VEEQDTERQSVRDGYIKRFAHVGSSTMKTKKCCMSTTPETSSGKVSSSFSNSSKGTEIFCHGFSSVSQDGLRLKPSYFKNGRTHPSNVKTFSEEYTLRPALEKHQNTE